MKLNNALLKKREVVGNMYVYTYVIPQTKEEIRIAKLIPAVKEVVIEGDNNNIVLPVIPEKITIKGSNNIVTIEEDEEDDLVIPSFMNRKPRKRAFSNLFNIR